MPLGFDEEKNEICPICGGIIWRGQKVLIEGANMTVCSSCAVHGTKIASKIKPSYAKTSYAKTSYAKTSYKKGNKGISTKRFERQEDDEIVSDYAKRIQKARISSKLNQDQFAQKLNEKPSLMRRIESGKAKPTMQLAKKIEKTFKVSLIEKSDATTNVNYKNYVKKSAGTSLGDMAFIKKKK